MSRKVLVAHVTRYGDIEVIPEKIAKVLRGKGLDIRVVNSSFEMVMISC